MSGQIFVGAALESVRDVLREGFGATLLARLCVAEVEVSAEAMPIDHSLYAVADNLLSRGLPTLTSIRVERTLCAALGLTREAEEDGVSIRFPFASEPSKSELAWLLQALCSVDPRVGMRLPSASPELESEEERIFFEETLPRLVGPWAPQLVELQREVETILPHAAQIFSKQRVDFSAELAREAEGSAGLVMEIDGAQHLQAAQRNLDERRGRAMEKAGWRTVRIEARHAARPPGEAVEAIQEYFTQPEAALAAASWERPLWSTPEGLRWMQAALTPFLIARLQKVLVRLVLDGLLDPEAERWRIAVVERDVPGARLALEDLRELLEHLCALEGRGQRIPAIELRVYRSAEFETCELAAGDEAERYDASGEGLRAFDADALIDLSVLQRAGFTEPEAPFIRRVCPDGVVVTVRSCHSQREEPRVTPGLPIDWSGADEVETPEALVYLLQNLFRKRAFREKQVDVMRPALRGGSVAGILPTGAGKSICFQLPALLQPGVTIVVAPLKSLMKDQHDNLVRAGIDRTVFINSSLDTKARERALKALQRGTYQFVFVSPERFHIQEFRQKVAALEVPLAYCVVDEAHCVSEWGHDFRTSYLRLGQNARAHCKTLWPTEGGRPALPIIALTGTASFDVLADLRRELGFQPGVPDVLPDSFERKELEFEIVPVPRPLNQEESAHDYWAVREAVIEQKMEALRKVMHRLPTELAGEGGAVDPETFFALDGHRTNSGLVFTPHANGSYGVQRIRWRIEKDHPALKGIVGCYASSDKSTNDALLDATQTAYKDNSLGLLVATKAFGMGIDKPNIRYVVHLNFSQSIESYYQEAGRAGRDRQKSRCIVLYCDQPVVKRDGTKLSLDLDLIMFFHGNSFRGKEMDSAVIDELLTKGARPDDNEAPNLDALLERMRPGEARVVTIPLESDSVEELASYLRAKVDPVLTRALVRPAVEEVRRRPPDPSEGVSAVDAIIEKILQRLGGKRAEGIDLEPHRGEIERFYLQSRNEDSTYKAIYRLSIIGLIEDYVIDYRANIVRARVRKRSDAEYVEALRSYLSKYVAPERITNLWDKIVGKTGAGIIRDCVDYLLDFIYQTLAAKRLEAVLQMEEAVREGAARGSAAFRERVNTYFDSRYTEDLRGDLGEGLAHYDLALVWKYADRTEGIADNVKHLRGACDRLLAAAPSNGALLLLRAFTRALEGGDAAFFHADFGRGWEIFRQEKGIARKEQMAALSEFYNRVAAYDSAAVYPVEEFILREHASWLASFNDRFVSLAS